MVESKEDTNWTGVMSTASAVLTSAATLGMCCYTKAQGYKLMSEAAVIAEPIMDIIPEG